MPPADALALMLPFPRKVLRHFASTFALEGLELIVESIVAVGGVIDEVRHATAQGAPSRRVRKKLATELEARLRELDRGVSALTDGELARGLDFIVRACSRLLHAEAPAEAIDAVIERGALDVRRAVHETLARWEMTRSGVAGAPMSAKRIRHLMQRGVGDSLQLKELAKMLPAALDGVLEAALALQGALDPESHGPPVGTIIGDYSVVKMLGSGGMGACVLAKPRSVRTAPYVVLKLPRRATGVHRTLFRNEALALLQLAEVPHPSIVKFVAYNDGAGVPPHLVMEYVDGVSLEKRIEGGPLPVDEALSIFACLARAVAHAHAYRMGHYDIKPANVMLPKRGTGGLPVLVDWGIAGATFRASVGTPTYMAPERYAQEIESTTAVSSDVYALACLLVEMTSGTPLLAPPLTLEDEGMRCGVMATFEQMTGLYGSVLVAQLIATDTELRRGRVERALKDAPRWVVELVLEMLAERPADRPAAAAVANRFESWEG
jgi:hypothetical protein